MSVGRACSVFNLTELHITPRVAVNKELAYFYHHITKARAYNHIDSAAFTKKQRLHQDYEGKTLRQYRKRTINCCCCLSDYERASYRAQKQKISHSSRAMIYRAYRDYTHAARRSVTDLYLYHLYTYMHACPRHICSLLGQNAIYFPRQWFFRGSGLIFGIGKNRPEITADWRGQPWNNSSRPLLWRTGFGKDP